jgi:type II secretory pathway pseudopilin PulG
MPHKNFRCGFTWIELLAIIIVLAVLLCLLIPAIQSARENSRKQTCINNLKQIGLAMHNYHDARKCFPNSASVIDRELKKEAGSWSFLHKILPNLCLSINLDKRLSKNDAIDPLTYSDQALDKYRDTVISEFICPSNTNKIFEDSVNKKIAFTNYKAMGATCMESLKLCVDLDSPPPYGDKKNHPDGGIFPGDKGIRISDLADGTSHTILVAETMDDSHSAWIAGADATMVGMPMAATYQRMQNSFWAPLDYNGGLYENATPAIQAMRTYTAFDFRPGQKDAGAYPVGVGRRFNYGPSSNHPGFVNHLFGDGGAKSIRNDVDYAWQFFQITRNNNDPAPCSPPDLFDH